VNFSLIQVRKDKPEGSVSASMGLTSSTPAPRPSPRQVPGPTRQPLRGPAPEREVPKLLFTPAAITTLIASGHLAPIVVLEDDNLHSSLNECNICMNNFQELNLLDCCKQVLLCTNCYVDIRNTRISSETPPPRSSLAASLGLGTGQSAVSAASSCPFCNKLGFKVFYKPGPPFDYSQDRRDRSSSGTACGASGDAQGPSNTKSASAATTASASATTVSSPEDAERNLYVPKSSTADRRELEEQLLKQHLYGQAPPGDRAFHPAPNRSSAGGRIGSSSSSDNRRGSAPGSGHRDLISRDLEEMRALRLSGAVRRSIMGSMSSGSSGPSSPRSPDPRNPRSRDEALRALAGQFMGPSAEDVEDLWLQQALKESMKAEYQGSGSPGKEVTAASHSPAVQEVQKSKKGAGAGGTDSGSGSDRSGKSSNSEPVVTNQFMTRNGDHSASSSSDSDSDADVLLAMAELEDQDMSYEEKVQLAMALSMSKQESTDKDEWKGKGMNMEEEKEKPFANVREGEAEGAAAGGETQQQHGNCELPPPPARTTADPPVL